MNKKIIIKIDLSIYDKVAALKTCYTFQDKFFTSLDMVTDTIAIATLVPKEKLEDSRKIECQFKNELIDQQIRLENEKLFFWIRKLIVEQAFKPINYNKLKIKIGQ